MRLTIWGRRLLIALAFAMIFTALWLALMPFYDREVRCGPPLFGADPPANVSITPGTCSESAADRLKVAGVVGVGASAVMVMLITGPRDGRRP